MVTLLWIILMMKSLTTLMDDERDKFEDEVEFAQRLSADPLPFNQGGHVRWQGKMR